MSWFDEQLRMREQTDDAQLSEALHSVAGAVMGERMTAAFSSRQAASSAIEEILKYYKRRPKETELPQELQTTGEQIEYLLRPHGIMQRTVKLEKGWYKDAIGPMLGTMKESGDLVALIPGRLSGYTLIDFAAGRKVRVGRKNEGLLDEEAICFYEPLPQKALDVGDLLAFMFRQLSAADIVLYLCLMGVSTLLGLLPPYLTKWLFGDVLASGSLRVLLSLAVFMICFSLCRLCFSAYQSLVNSRISTKQSIAVQAAVMSRIMSLPATFFKQYASGDLSQRAMYVQQLCSTLFSTIGVTGLTSVFSLVYIGQVFAFAPSLVIPSLGITVLTVLFSLWTTLAQTKISRQRMEKSAKLSGLTYATISGVRKIKLAGAEKRMFARWAKQYAELSRLEYDPPAMLKLAGTINMWITLAGTLLLYAIALKNRVSVANYYAFNSAYGMVSGAFAAFASVFATIANIKPILEMARPIMEAEPERSEQRKTVTKLKGAIELNHVTFRYSEDGVPVIDDLSMKVNPGEYLAIVGPTGCGKSTLLRLLLGFEKPQKGSVLYDRQDISKLDIQSLRRKVGVVMQDGKLFLGDIFSNIAVAAPMLTVDEAWEAARIASIDEDIRKMPMGMNTLISEGQGGISGGQRQRLMIARAVAAKPRVLMFDEATSALDNLTQKRVTEAIDSLDCTRIVIAHRLSTIRRADRIVYLEGGKIREEGTYEELIALDGSFAALVARQRLDIDAD